MNREDRIPGTRGIVYRGIGLYILIGAIALVAGWLIPYPASMEGKVLMADRGEVLVGTEVSDLIKVDVGDSVLVGDGEGVVALLERDSVGGGRVLVKGDVGGFRGSVQLKVLTRHYYFQTLFFKKLP